MPGNRQMEFEAIGYEAESPLSVTQLTWYLKQVVEEAVPRVWLEGEISDLSRPSSGHLYFTLKDEKAQIRAVIWRSTAARLKMNLENGMSIVVCGAVEIYPPRGTYQIVVNQVQPLGIGELQLAFQQLFQKLTAEGLFDPARKRPLPSYPKRIGFVTSPSGAAIHDFLESAEQLWNDFELWVIPSRVQGNGAAAEIVQGIQLAQKIRPILDLVIVGRGGGSIEDLWCFNEEKVVRALSSCEIPTVSAVGHEVDVTLSDLVADARAMTPSQAASLVFPKKSEVTGLANSLGRRAIQLMRGRLQRMKQHLNGISDRPILSRPQWIVQTRKQQVDDWEKRLLAAIERQLAARQQRLSELSRAAEALSPLAVLQRGYSLTKLAGSSKPLKSFKEVAADQRIVTRLTEGVIISRVESTDDDAEFLTP
jgi:exodeoxyribonuclease VII large subunit